MDAELLISQVVGDGIAAPNARWSFDAHVAKTFSEHVRRSVPLYETGHELVCSLSDFFVHGDSTCYEIGVAAGDLFTKLVGHNTGKSARWIGLDLEESMIDKAR